MAFKYIEIDQQSVESLLYEIEEIVMALPIRPGNKRVIMQKISDLGQEIETAIEVSAVDYE